ncbi:MAG: TIGR02147 family protein [Oligoflexales bacterium]
MKSSQEKIEVCIYSYQDYREYLLSIYEFRSKNVEYYSYRRFSRDLGFSSFGYIRNIIRGKKNLGEAGVFKISASLKFNKREREYFKDLVAYGQASTTEDKKKFKQNLKDLAPSRFQRIIEEDLSYFLTNRACSIIGPLVIIYGKEFSSDPLWIARRIQFRFSIAEIQQALLFLIENNFLIKKNGNYQYISRKISTPDEVKSNAIQKFHRNLLKESTDALSFPISEREFSHHTLTISQNRLQELKLKMKEMQNELRSWINQGEVDTDKKEKICISINMQMYPVSSLRK